MSTKKRNGRKPTDSSDESHYHVQVPRRAFAGRRGKLHANEGDGCQRDVEYITTTFARAVRLATLTGWCRHCEPIDAPRLEEMRSLSQLDEIGPARLQTLRQAGFETVGDIEQADVNLASIEGLSMHAAAKIHAAVQHDLEQPTDAGQAWEVPNDD